MSKAAIKAPYNARQAVGRKLSAISSQLSAENTQREAERIQDLSG
jgi:hypothetical protein